jgi:Fic family protein
MSTTNRKVWELAEVLRRLKPMSAENQERLEKKFRLEFNFNSNHLEGNTLTYTETELLLILGETASGKGHQIREYQEMKGHDVAYALVKGWAADKDHRLTEADIKDLNRIILVEPFWKEALTSDNQPTRRLISVGEYKKFSNSVRLQNGEIFHYASPEDTPIKMGELMEWYRKEDAEGALHPVELAALFHYKFVRIHPFDDGNGRISRLLMMYVTMRHGLPPILIKSEDKPNYLRALHEADVGNVGIFIDYIADQLFWSLGISIKAANGESINEPGDLDKRLVALKKAIGEGPDDVVRLKKGKQAILDVYLGVVIPLAVAWEGRLRDFDSFLIARDNTVSINNYAAHGQDLSLVAKGEGKDRLYGILDAGQLPPGLVLKAHPKGLRRGNKDTSLNGGEIQVHFFENSYEIRYLGSKSVVNRLYHQNLSDGEISEIVDAVGTWLLDIVEKELGRAVKS